VAFVGDGGVSMLMADVVNAVRYELPIKGDIHKKNTLGRIKWEQIVFLGNPEYAVALHPIDFARIAECCGGVGYRCERPEEVRPALETAFKSPKPAIVKAVVDAFEPPLPAQVTPMQAYQFAEALVRGEPQSGEVISTVIKDQIQELV
jgi:pyruvate dehydrogenase (quinone)/pyruvate oxidase